MRKRMLGRSGRGQSMVEFALTSLLFIGLLVSIIEVARIMHAYLTLQHAARTGARYAITGQWDADFATNRLAAWQEGSTDPEQRIRPCWPLFHDDPIEAARTPNGPAFYQPYRGPRTCSVESRVLRQMRSLNLDPNAGPEQPRYYEIVISSRVVDNTPTEGTFARGVAGSPSYQSGVPYATYYTNTSLTPGVVRGYPGGPQQKVAIQIQYNIPVILPLVSRAIEYIPIRATVTMLNESFGSTGNLTEASSAPYALDLEPLHIPIPPDLTIENVTRTTSDVKRGEPITYNYSIRNLGELNVPPGDVPGTEAGCLDKDSGTACTGFVLTFYLVEVDPTTGEGPVPSQELFKDAPLPLDYGYTEASVRVARDASNQPVRVYYADLQPDQSVSGAVTIVVQKPKHYRVYAFIDSGQHVDEAGQGSTRDDRREENNIADAGLIAIGNRVDVVVLVEGPGTLAFGQVGTYTIRVRNNRPSGEPPHEIPGLNVKLGLPNGLKCAQDPCPWDNNWETGSIPSEGEVTMIASITPDGTVSGSDVVWQVYYQFNNESLVDGFYEDPSTMSNNVVNVRIAIP